MINLPKYENIKKEDHISGQDFDPIIVKDVLSEEQIAYIYKYIGEHKEDEEKWAGRKSWMIDRIDGPGIDISDRIENIVKDALKVEVQLNEYPFLLRYSPKFGSLSKLFPHSDYRDSQRITIDIQLNYNEDWAVVIEGKNYNLKYNEALLFLGTQQLHWRENKVLKDDTEIDMLIANVHYLPSRELDENQVNILDKRSYHLKIETDIDEFERNINE
jgi:hypothetical protein